jgi:hypothetical protein
LTASVKSLFLSYKTTFFERKPIKISARLSDAGCACAVGTTTASDHINKKSGKR